MSLTVSFLPVALILIFACGNPSETAPGVAKVASEDHQYQLRLDQGVAPIQPTMYGIFFEDINFAADGGIYAEMVKNRSFEFLEPLMGWAQPASDRFSMNAKSGFASAMNHGTDAANKIFLRANIYADQGYNLVNEGFKGMGFKAGLKYNLSLKARQIEGASNLHIELVDSSNTVLAQAPITVSGKDWKTYTAELTPSAQAMKGKLNIRFEGKGIVDLDFISLFPADTWKNRPNGLRADLVQLLADLKPGFLRFPGGCIVEGRTLARRYQWKKTVGKVEEREFLINRWNTEFKHRPAPDYFQSFGLGFFEYFQLAEDIGATPLPILSCGMACQFNTGEMVPLEELQPFVQDALDLIEFANGPVTSAWGKLRAEMGHPETFNMRLIGIGNEQWGPEYIERYNVFEKAIKSKYPEITIVSGSGPFPDGEMFDAGTQKTQCRNHRRTLLQKPGMVS